MLAILGGVIGFFAYSDRSEALQFKQQGQLGTGTIFRKYKTRRYTSRGKKRTGYLADINYSEQPKLSESQPQVAPNSESSEDLLDFIENIDVEKDFGSSNGQWEMGTVKLQPKQFQTIPENSEIEIYFLLQQKGQIALRSWVDSRTEKSFLSYYTPTLLFVLPGTILIFWGTWKRVKKH